MIDLGHWFVWGPSFDKYINLNIPNFNWNELRDYTKPGWDPELLLKLSNYFKISDISNTTLTLSTNLSFNIILNRYLLDDNNIHLFLPTFSCFLNQLKFKYANQIKEYNNFSLDDVYSQLKNWDIFLIVNPSNPDWKIIDNDILLYHMRKFHEKWVKIIFDFTWFFTIFNENNHLDTLTELLNQSIQYGHISIFWLSKIFFSPGIRLSYVISSAEIIRNITRDHDMLAVSCSYFDQKYIVKNIDSLLDWAIDYNLINKQLTSNLTKIIGYVNKTENLFIKNIPNGWIFLIIYSKKNIKIEDLIEKTWVIVYSLDYFWIKSNWFRITISKEFSYIKSWLSKIDHYLNLLS